MDYQGPVLMLILYHVGTRADLSAEECTVSDLAVDVKGNLTTFKWQAPCGWDDGSLSHFLVVLVGVRQHYSPTNYTLERNVTLPLEESYSTNILTTSLTAEARYNVTVVPVRANGTYGTNQTNNFTVPARVPETPKDLFSPYLRVDVASPSSAMVTLRNDLFQDTEGSILYYAILVAENNFTRLPEARALPNGAWPNESTWAQMQTHPSKPYQATPLRWRPFKDGLSASAVFALGVNTSCSVADKSRYCNGPLKPDTRYALRVRAFTAAGYRDSSQYIFQTDEKVSLASTLMKVLVALAGVAVVGFIYLATKEHVYWLTMQNKSTIGGEVEKAAADNDINK